MSLGVCSCPQGKDGAPCKHQYLIWAANLAICTNFVPISNPDERQKLAEIALGKTLPLSYYTSLRGQRYFATDMYGKDRQHTADHNDETPVTTCASELDSMPMDKTDTAGTSSNNQTGMVSDAVHSLQSACSALKGILESCQDSKLSEATLKFSERLTQLTASSLTNGKLAAALFDFGHSELRKGKNGKKIKVQPNRKRKSGNGSRQAVAKGRPVTVQALEVPSKKAKQSHDLACSVRENRNPSRKSGSHVMNSRTRNVPT
jgi:hypothetical protein